MRNAKSACILEHNDFTYVANFDSMILWVITEEDEDDPVTTLEIARFDHKRWGYRPYKSESEFTEDSDVELVEKLERHYEQYLNQMIVGRYGRLPANQASQFRMQRVRAVNKPS